VGPPVGRRMTAMQRRVVIAAYDDRLRRSLREGLEALDYVTWGEASDGLTALAQVKRSRPHLVVLAPPLPSLDADQVAETLIRGEAAPVLLVLPEDAVAARKENGQGMRWAQDPARVREIVVCAQLLRPFTQLSLAEAVDRAGTQFGRLLQIRTELRGLRHERGGSRLLERAKSLLMRRLMIGEPEAFWRIQHHCLESPEPARCAVEAVIEAYRLSRE
jgi:two-component system, response regulator PdtaR